MARLNKSETIRRCQIREGAMAADEGKVKIEKFDGFDGALRLLENAD